MKIYVASSWRNEYQPETVSVLRFNGHEVYDFRNPDKNDSGFHWSEIDPDWKSWSVSSYINNLHDSLAESGFNKDYEAMKWADACVLLMPSGRSAHLEAGWFVGNGKPLIILIPTLNLFEPELMYKMASAVVENYADLLDEVSACKIGVGTTA